MTLADVLPHGIEVWQLGVIAGAMFFAGIIKGATGAGAPIFAIPVMTAVVDVRFAIITMLLPNLLSNIWQALHFRKQQPERSFLGPYVGAGVVGVILGSVLLATLSLDVLSLVVSVSVAFYIAFRLSKPNWRLSMAAGRQFAVPAGMAAGLLQGSTGLAAPALLTFLNALKLERLTFVATVSLVFVSFSVTHIASLGIGGLLTLPAMLFSLAAIAPMALGMTIGNRLLNVMSAQTFDRLVLGLLAVIAVVNVVNVLLG